MTVREIRTAISKTFPRMNEGQLASASTEEAAVYSLARMLDAFIANETKFLADIHKRLVALESPSAATSAPAPTPASSIDPSIANSAKAPDDPAQAADWIMGGVDNSPAASDPGLPTQAPHTNGDVPRAAPATGQAPLPPEILASMAKPPEKPADPAPRTSKK